jgi:hypothetical protein
MPLMALATRFPVSKLVAAREKIPDWLLDVSAMRLLIPGTVQPCRTLLPKGNGQVTTLYFTRLYILFLSSM